MLVELVCSLFVPLVAAQARPSEDDVKAAYLFNFGKFVQEPQLVAQPVDFVICVLGRDAILPVLERITRHEHIDDRAVAVRRIDKAVVARGCAIVYLGRSESARLDDDLAALKGAHALTVGVDPQFLARGGMLQFLLQDQRVRFAVNLDAVSGGDLRLSSELLRVAASVSGTPLGEVPR
ncbi:MAG TPA: YfiR family protein [Granulicella sp.]|nr:YfiR family protein [Granulicella sp.]